MLYQHLTILNNKPVGLSHQSDRDPLQPLRIGAKLAKMSVDASQALEGAEGAGETIVRGQNFLVAPRYF